VTSPTIRAKRYTWLRAIGYGFLAEIATIATIIAVVMLIKYASFQNMSDADYASHGERVGKYNVVYCCEIYTYIFAHRLMPKVSSRFSEHGIVVALAATTLSIAGSIAGHQSVPSEYIFATLLKILAGARAGFVHLRSLRVHSGGEVRS
jgi:hypothetical protein